MSRESSYSAAGNACALVETAAAELQNAINAVLSEINGISANWKGEAGSAMADGLSNWCASARALVNRANTLSAKMRSSQSYDYGLWNAAQAAGGQTGGDS